MKTIGLIGGMSWESTVPYYQTINRVVGQRLGGLHSAKIALYSVEFDEIEKLQHEGRWEESGEILADAARAVRRAGADFIVLCTNTMHKVAAADRGGGRRPAAAHRGRDGRAGEGRGRDPRRPCWARSSRWKRTSTAAASRAATDSPC